jgi:uncharacterized protein
MSGGQRWARDERAEGPVVTGFSGGGFVVDGNVYRGLFLTPKRAEEWSPPAVSALTLDSFAPLFDLERPPEFIVLGTGDTLVFPPRALIRAVEERGLGLEIMDSRAAARTWGLLRSEQRWIAAALMPL